MRQPRRRQRPGVRRRRLCNGVETCQLGICSSGTAPDHRTDGNGCTLDGCNASTGCTHTIMSGCCTTSAECSDGNLCDGREVCDSPSHLCENSGGALLCAPGSRRDARTCAAEWFIDNPFNSVGILARDQRCQQGDPTCDHDTDPGTCTFRVGICLRVIDPRLDPPCTPSDIAMYTPTGHRRDNIRPRPVRSWRRWTRCRARRSRDGASATSPSCRRYYRPLYHHRPARRADRSNDEPAWPRHHRERDPRRRRHPSGCAAWRREAPEEAVHMLIRPPAHVSIDVDPIDTHLAGYGIAAPPCDRSYRAAVPRFLDLFDRLGIAPPCSWSPAMPSHRPSCGARRSAAGTRSPATR